MFAELTIKDILHSNLARAFFVQSLELSKWMMNVVIIVHVTTVAVVVDAVIIAGISCLDALCSVLQCQHW